MPPGILIQYRHESPFPFFPTVAASPVALLCQLLAQETNRALIFEADVKVPMRDGVQLAANIWRPKAEGRYPVILMRSPYGKMDEKFDKARRYTAAGYVMVVQDCRGRGKSEGAWGPLSLRCRGRL